MFGLRSSRAVSRLGQGQIKSLSVVSSVNAAVAGLPMREAVRYSNKNIKWTASELLTYADSHANALIELGFQPGETMAVWLPESPEKHVTLLAGAKIGANIVDAEPDSLTTVADMRQFLKLANCKVIIFEPESESQDNMLLLRKSIPEFFYYDDSHAQLFHSKHFPVLKWFIHTGFDVEMGALNYKKIFLPDPFESYVDKVVPTLKPDTPLYTLATKGPNGITLGPVQTHGNVLKHPSWSFAQKLVENEYFEL